MSAHQMTEVFPSAGSGPRSVSGASAGIPAALSRSAAGALDWFVPARMRDADHAYRIAQIFVSSHLTAMPLALPIALYLYSITPRPGAVFWIIVGMIVGFGVFPFILKLVGRWVPVAVLAMQYFTALIFFAAYHYGGVASPFLAWLIVVAIGSYFYFDGVPRVRAAVLAVFGCEIAGFFLLGTWGPAWPTIVPRGELLGLGLVSSCVVAFDVGINSLQFAKMVRTQQRRLQEEVEVRRTTEISLRRAKEEAEIANRAKTQFLANMSHELRTPLNAIIGFSDILAREQFGPLGEPRYADFARDIHASGGHLLRIVNDVLDVAKVESPTIDMAEETVSMTDIIAPCIRLVTERARVGGVEIAEILDPGLPLLRVDGRRMKQVVLNLVSNAVKFTPSGGRVEIRASAGADGFRIVVADTGIGMTAAEIELALSAFGQVDATHSRRYEGTGLGLTLAKAMVELHGGTLTIESVQSRGTAVTVTLPPERMIDPRAIA